MAVNFDETGKELVQEQENAVAGQKTVYLLTSSWHFNRVGVLMPVITVQMMCKIINDVFIIE